MPPTTMQSREILVLARSTSENDRKNAADRIRAALDAAQGQTEAAAEALEISGISLRRLYSIFPELGDHAATLRLRNGVPGGRRGMAVDVEEVRRRLAQGQPVRRRELVALTGVTPMAIAGLVGRGALIEGEDGVTAASAIAWLERRGQWPQQG